MWSFPPSSRTACLAEDIMGTPPIKVLSPVPCQAGDPLMETGPNFVPSPQPQSAAQILVPQGLQPDQRVGPVVRPFSVNDSLPRTSLGHGLSAHELRRISGAMHFLKSTGLLCAYVVLGDEILDLTEAPARASSRNSRAEWCVSKGARSCRSTGCASWRARAGSMATSCSRSRETCCGSSRPGRRSAPT